MASSSSQAVSLAGCFCVSTAITSRTFFLESKRRDLFHLPYRLPSTKLRFSPSSRAHAFAAGAAAALPDLRKDGHGGSQPKARRKPPELPEAELDVVTGNERRRGRRRKDAKPSPSLEENITASSRKRTISLPDESISDISQVRTVSNAENSSDDLAFGKGSQNGTTDSCDSPNGITAAGNSQNGTVESFHEIQKEGLEGHPSKVVERPSRQRSSKVGQRAKDMTDPTLLKEETIDSGNSATSQQLEVHSNSGKKPRRRKKRKDEKIIVNVIEEDELSACTSASREQRPCMCLVRWLVKARLNPNQQLFVVGTLPCLGSWDSSMALGFSVCEETGQLNTWEAQSEVPFETDLEYNYFIQVREGDNQYIVWRPGSKLRLIIPTSEEVEHGGITIKDSLDFNVENKLPALSWGGLQREIGFPAELLRFLGNSFVADEPPLDQDTSLGVSVDHDDDSLKFSKAKDEKIHMKEKEDLAEADEQAARESLDATISASRQSEPVTVSPSKHFHAEDSHVPDKISSKLRKYMRKKVFPREEPWLMESSILVERAEQSKKPATDLDETDKQPEDVDSSVVDNVGDALQEKEETAIEILINSSKCTMERIAILENGKLVELLLKPVNSDINVGNVYLGVVKKLLPGMTGVFVDIGHPRVALLSITKNIYPFTFPPISALKDESMQEVGSDLDGHASMGEEEDILAEKEEDEDSGFEDNEEVGEDEVEILDEEDDADGRNNVDTVDDEKQVGGRRLLRVNGSATRPITVNFGQRFTKWRKVEEGMRIIVQVKREPLAKKGAKVCAFPLLASRFWILGVSGRSVGVSKKIQGPERKRLKELATLCRKPGYDLTVRTEAAGQCQEDLEKDLARLLETWKDIMEQAEAVSVAAESGQDGAVPALLHRAMDQSLSIVRDFFAEKVHRMVVDSAQTYHEVTAYLQEVAPQLLNRVELYTGTVPIFDVFNLEAEIDKLLNERVQLPNGAYLVIEETEALVSIDVNGGAGMLGKNIKSAAILEANLAASRQIAVELRLRDIGGIIVIDFIDMDNAEHEVLVYEEVRKAIQPDRSVIYMSEISDLGLMEVTRRRVRPSVTFMISDTCSCCRGTGRVEALESTLSKIERAILRLVASQYIHSDGKTWQRVLLRVDPVMFEFLTRKQRTAQLSSSLKVYIILKVGRDMARGHFELTLLNLGNEQRAQAIDSGHRRSSTRKSTHRSTSRKSVGIKT